MNPEDPHDDPVVVYRTVAILLAAFSVALLFIPFDWMAADGKAREFVNTLVARLGELGARMLFAGPCAVLAAIAARLGWGPHGD